MLLPSSSSIRFSAGCTRLAPTGTNSMPLRLSDVARSISMSDRFRQLTATHGLLGTKWNRGLLETTVTLSSRRASSRIS